MGIITIRRDWGVEPCMVRFTTTDTLAEVQVTGYLGAQQQNIELINKGAFQWELGDLVAVHASDGSDTFELSDDFLSLMPTGGGSGDFLLKSANLSDVNSTETSFANLGFGSGQSIVLSDGDFVSGEYVLTNPCPNFIRINVLFPGTHDIKLPPAQGMGSFSLSEGPYIISQGPVQPVTVSNSNGSLLATLTSPITSNFVLSDKSTATGTWIQFNRVTDIEADSRTLSGLVEFTSLDGSIVINSSAGTVDLSSSGGGSGSGTQNIVWVGTNGVDTPGNGTFNNPFASLSYAISQITTASSSNPFSIKMGTGFYTETNLSLKPWIYIDGNSSQLTVTGSITLDSSWSTGGELYINNFSNLNWPGTVTLDFTSLASGFSLFNLSNNLQNSATTLNIIGSSTHSTILIYGNDVNFAGAWDINITNCYGAINGGNVGTVNINHTSEATGGNFSIIDVTHEDPLTVTDNTTAGFLLFHTTSKVTAGATYAEAGAGTCQIFARGTQYLSAPTLDNGTGGGSVNFDSDILDALPTLANGAIYNPSSIADAMSANNYFTTPANYTPTAGGSGLWSANSVVGNLKGIDLKLGALTSGNIPQIVYADSVTGNDSTADGSPALPFATYEAASAFAALSATAANQYVVDLNGNFNEPDGMDVYPFVNITSRTHATYTSSGSVTLDSSWQTTPNGFCRMEGFQLNTNQVFLEFLTYQNSALEFAVDWGTTSDIQIHGSKTTAGEIITFYGKQNYDGNPQEYELYDITAYLENVASQGDIIINNNNSVYPSFTTIKNSQPIGTIFNSTSSTQNSYLSVFGSPQITTIELEDKQSNLTIDSTSYTSQVTLTGTATIANLNIVSLSDAVNCSTYTPVHFTSLPSSNYGSNSLTAYIAGIDAKLAGGGSPIAQQVWVNSVNGLDTAAHDGSIDSPWASYNYALSQVGSSATSTNQILIHIIGQQSMANFDVAPWIHVDGHNSGVITCTGSVINDLLWQSTNNAQCYIKNCNFTAPSGLSALFGASTGNLITYQNCDFTNCNNVFTQTTNTNSTSNLLVIDSPVNPLSQAFIGGMTIQDTAIEINDAFIGSTINVQATGASGSAGASIVINGCQVSGIIALDSSGGTGGFCLGQFNYSNVQVNPSIIGANSELLPDVVSYNFIPNLSAGATFNFVEPTNLTDGLVLTSFTPSNYSFVSGNWGLNSLTGFLQGIDNALSGVGSDVTLQLGYDNQTTGAKGNIILLNSANPLFIINNDTGVDQTTIVSYNGTTTPTHRWGFTCQGLNSAPTAINYVQYLANVISSTAGSEYSDAEVTAYRNGVSTTVSKTSGQDGSLSLPVTGGKLKIVEATNGAKGHATLVAGTVTVSNTAIAANDHISLSVSSPGGVQGFLSFAINAGVSFTITSSSSLETSTISWVIIGSA